MADIPLPPSTTKKSNKIRDIVRLQQMLKKWKKAAIATKKNNNDVDNVAVAPTAATTNKTTTTTTTTTKGLNKFLKKTLSFSDISNNSSSSYLSSSGQDQDIVAVRKGYLAVWVGREEDAMKKFVIPTDYLAHQAFSVLLRDAEEEFGFQQEGILKIPCDVPLFEKILKLMSDNNSNNKKNQQQRPTLLKSSSSTSSFFLYEQQPPPPPQPELLIINNNNNDHPTRSSTFDSQLKTPPTTPTRHLPLYCR